MQKRNFFHSLLLMLALVGLSSCGDVTDEYSRYPCRVRIDNISDMALGSALNQSAPGVFCIIEKKQIGGASFWHCTTSQGLTSDIRWTKRDELIAPLIGMNNGIIVGYGNLDFPAQLFAYDRECPNCFAPDAVPVKSKPLEMDEKGHATCNVCKRVYDMNNRGIVVSGEGGKKMVRYHASASGVIGGSLIVQ